jgi:hypothetical protein
MVPYLAVKTPPTLPLIRERASRLMNMGNRKRSLGFNYLPKIVFDPGMIGEEIEGMRQR